MKLPNCYSNYIYIGVQLNNHLTVIIITYSSKTITLSTRKNAMQNVSTNSTLETSQLESEKFILVCSSDSRKVHTFSVCEFIPCCFRHFKRSRTHFSRPFSGDDFQSCNVKCLSHSHNLTHTTYVLQKLHTCHPY